MPTYDYVCRQCGHEFELFQTISARVKRKCPKCGMRKLERLIGTGSGVIFKGSGFYQTDYRSDAYNKAAKAERGDGAAAPAEKPKAGAEQPAASKSGGESTPPAGNKAKPARSVASPGKKGTAASE